VPGKLREVPLVVAERAVLVLDLDEDDRSALVDLVRHDHAVDVVQVLAHGGEVTRLVPADADLRVAEQPCGQAAVVPFRADVRAGPDDGVHPGLGDHAQEPVKVEVPGQVELTGLGSVGVPCDVRLDGVEPHLACLADPVGPQVRMHPEVVQGTGKDPERAAVEQEVRLADGELRHPGLPG
jgi:hypothetical protein